MSRFLIAAACMLTLACGSPKSRDNLDSMATESTWPATSAPGDTVEEPGTIVETPPPPAKPASTTTAQEAPAEETPTPPIGGGTETASTSSESTAQTSAPVEPPS